MIKKDEGRGYARMWQLVVVFVLLLVLSAYIDPLTTFGVLAKSLPLLAKASINCLFLYWILRLATGERTHLMPKELERGNYLVLAYAMVVAASVMAG